MTREEVEEIKQLNLIKSEGTAKFIFEDDGNIFPSKIVNHSETYGDYVLNPAIYFNIFWENKEKISSDFKEIGKLSGAVQIYVIKELAGGGSGFKQPIEYVLYLCDLDENKDWYENNKDNPNCRILKDYPEYKEIGLPLGGKNIQSKLEKFYQKYPIANPKNH